MGISKAGEAARIKIAAVLAMLNCRTLLLASESIDYGVSESTIDNALEQLIISCYYSLDFTPTGNFFHMIMLCIL